MPARRILGGLTLSLVVSSQASAQQTVDDRCTPAPLDSATAFVNATLIDGTGADKRERMTVLTRAERIAAIFPTGSEPLPDGVEVIDLDGAFLIPGLIDAHVHVATDPAVDDERSVTERRLCSALLGGVTTVRDMAGDVRALGSLARDALVGSIVSPDIVYVALFAGPAFFSDPRTRSSAAGAVPGELPWMRSITDSTDLVQAVAEARGTGAGALKLYARIEGPLVRRVVAEAHRQNLPVWSHLQIGPAGPLEVVEAGMDVVSHAQHLGAAMGLDRYRALLSDSTEFSGDVEDPAIDRLHEAMIERGTLLDATLFIFKSRPRTLAVAGALSARAHAAGVRLVAGTDSLGVPDPDVLPNLHDEMALLVELAGLTPAEALRAATETAAAAANVLESRGTITVGKLADMVVLEADPLEDIAHTRTVRLVVKRGRVHARDAHRPGGS